MSSKPTSEQTKAISNFEIKYNSKTYNLKNSNDAKLVVKKTGLDYQTVILSETNKCLLTYENISISSNDILYVYVIFQYIMGKTTLIELSEHEWDYSKWKMQITSDKKLPQWAIILNCLLNMKEFNKPFNIKNLDETIGRGWGGERPREIYYKKGFPLYTSKTNKCLKLGERLLKCPFPICPINPTRKAIVSDTSSEKKCFTCGCKEGEKDYFGNICNFEKGHFEPHILGGADTAGHQCKWCNSFYKDKINWNHDTGKPEFNLYAILRDAPKKEIVKILKLLGFTPKDHE